MQIDTRSRRATDSWIPIYCSLTLKLILVGIIYAFRHLTLFMILPTRRKSDGKEKRGNVWTNNRTTLFRSFLFLHFWLYPNVILHTSDWLIDQWKKERMQIIPWIDPVFHRFLFFFSSIPNSEPNWHYTLMNKFEVSIQFFGRVFQS